MSDLEPIKLDFTVNSSTVFEEFAKMVKAATEQTKSVDNAQKKFKEYINTQLSASGALSKSAELTEAQTKALQRHAEQLDYLKQKVSETTDPTQLGVYNYQLNQAQQAIEKIIASANNKVALIDPAEAEKAKKELQEAGRLLDQISDKTFNAHFADPQELEVLSTEINNAKDEMEQLGVVIDFISAKMGTMDAGSQAFKDLEKDIETANQMLGRLPQSYDATGNSIDQMTEALQEFKNQLNVETEPEAIKILNQNIEELENSIKKIKNAGKEGFDEFGNKLEENKEKSVNLQTELENLVQTMARLRIAGEQNSQEYAELRDRATEVRSAIQSTNQEINASASSTSGLDTLVRATSAIASGYSLAQGAAALFGAENEEVEQSIMKITAAMSVLQSLQQIQTELKRNDSIVTKAQTASQALYTTVVGTSTGALKLFRIALAGTGIGLVIILLASLIANWDKVTASIKNSFPALKGFGDKVDEVKAHVMGFLNAYLSLYETVWNTLKKLFTLDIKGAVNEALNVISNAKNAYNKAKQDSLDASAQDKRNERLKKSLEVYNRETEIIEKKTGKKQYDRREKALNAQLRLVEKGSKEETDLIHQRNILLAEKEKERTDEAKKYADKRQREAEKAAKKAEQLATQEAEAKKTARASIAQAEREYQKSRMSATDKELADIQDKYAKLRVEAQKAKLGAFDLMRIDKLEKAETKSVTDKQANEQFFKELEEQKEMYAAYEVFKSKVGKEEADRRYQNELSVFENYGALINAEIEKIKALGDTLSPEQLQKLEKLQGEKKSYDKDKNKETEQKYADAYNALMSFDDKRRAIETKYQQDKILLSQISDAKIREAKLAELEFQKKSALNAVNTEAYNREMIMQKMSDNLLGITKRELDTRIASLEEYLKTAGDNIDQSQRSFIQNELNKAKAVRASTDIGVEEKILLQQKEAIIKRITELQKKGITNVSDELAELEGVNMKLKDILAKKFAKVSEVAGQLGGAFSELGGALREYDEGLADTVETMGELLNVASDVSGAVASFASGDIVGGITKTIKAIGSIFRMGAKARESERKAQEEIKKYHAEIFQSQLNYNAELRKRVAEEVKLNDLYKSRVTNIREEMQANRKNFEQVKKDQQEVFKRLLKSQTIVGKHTEKYGGFLGLWRKTRVVDDKKTIAEILGIGKWIEKEIKFPLGKIKLKIFEPGEVEMTDEIFDKLEKLNAEKPLTGDAKTAYEQLKKLRDEYGSLEQAQREFEKQLREAITGTTADSLAESIKQGIASGKKSFADFADDIEGFLRNAVLAGLETDLFKTKTQKLHEALAEMMQDGVITAEEREQFNQLYMAIVEESKQKMEMLNQAGINVIKQQENANSLQGSIKAASQESIDILSGHIAGLRLYVMDIVKLMKSNGASGLEKLSKIIAIQLNIERNTRKTAENTEKLHDIDEGISKVAKAIKNNNGDAKGLGF
ncbi:hypothetical protein [Riemerella columbina]|uniref:hypothetical protein n=1 Tax=Riemerella columbina TaxID=103810 RepID=UPI0003817A82|nr:hypothetical protein [Riemerella columbina]